MVEGFSGVGGPVAAQSQLAQRVAEVEGLVGSRVMSVDLVAAEAEVGGSSGVVFPADLWIPGDVGSPVESDVYPLQVRWMPVSASLVVYVPPGSLQVNGENLQTVPLGAYTGLGPHWYSLSGGGPGLVVLSFDYDPSGASDPLTVGFRVGDGSLTGDDSPGRFHREIVVASIEQAGSRVVVRQAARGPLVYEFGVRSLNGAMGDLNVVGDPEGVTLAYGDGEGGGVLTRKYHIKAEREEESSGIVVSLQADEDEEDDPGYCNAISDDGGGGDTPSNDISNDDTSDHNQGSGTNGEPGAGGGGNAISRWPCNKEAA